MNGIGNIGSFFGGNPFGGSSIFNLLGGGLFGGGGSILQGGGCGCTGMGGGNGGYNSGSNLIQFLLQLLGFGGQQSSQGGCFPGGYEDPSRTHCWDLGNPQGPQYPDQNNLLTNQPGNGISYTTSNGDVIKFQQYNPADPKKQLANIVEIDTPNGSTDVNWGDPHTDDKVDGRITKNEWESETKTVQLGPNTIVTMQADKGQHNGPEIGMIHTATIDDNGRYIQIGFDKDGKPQILADEFNPDKAQQDGINAVNQPNAQYLGPTDPNAIDNQGNNTSPDELVPISQSPYADELQSTPPSPQPLYGGHHHHRHHGWVPGTNIAGQPTWTPPGAMSAA